MTLFAANGSKIYIGAALAQKSVDFVAADFTSQTWTEVKPLESLGPFGDTATEVTFAALGEGREKRIKGTRSAGTMEIVCGVNFADAGQLALLAAEKTIHDYAFRIVLNDAPQGGTPSERLFIAVVGSAVEAIDAANNVVKLNASLWINSNVVRINAAAG